MDNLIKDVKKLNYKEGDSLIIEFFPDVSSSDIADIINSMLRFWKGEIIIHRGQIKKIGVFSKKVKEV